MSITASQTHPQVKRSTDEHSEYNVLRIKRKRNEEPLDALVVDSKARRKKTRGAMNVFQFAETVEAGAFDDEKETKAIRDRIAALAHDETQKVSHEKTSASAPLPSRAAKRSRDEANRQYTILPSSIPSSSSETSVSRRRPTAPPKVWSKKDLDELKRAHEAGFRLYDAVLASNKPSGQNTSAAPPEMDEEMAKFLPMLQDYLKVSDVSSLLAAATTASTMPPSASRLELAKEDDGDYVYDVFYQRPTTFQELYEPSANAYNNIATLTNVPEELGLSDSDSEDEDEDEADEDSNAEDWYANDYPEDEESDESADGSEGSDVFHDGTEDEVHEWR